MRRHRFPLGHIVATPGALAAFEDAGDFPSALLDWHAAGDWGELDDHDRRANEWSLEHGLRLLSAYSLSNGTRIWIITEADRSATTSPIRILTKLNRHAPRCLFFLCRLVPAAVPPSSRRRVSAPKQSRPFCLASRFSIVAATLPHQDLARGPLKPRRRTARPLTRQGTRRLD